MVSLVGRCTVLLAGLWAGVAQGQWSLPVDDRPPDTRETLPAPEDFLRLPEVPPPPPRSTPEAAPEVASPAPEEVIHRATSPDPDRPRSLTGLHGHETRKAWEDSWVVTADLLNNAAGGRATGFTGVALLEFLGSLDGEALGLWPGGMVGIHLAYVAGDSPSAKVGDFAGVSGIDAGGANGLFVWDAWLQQRLPWWGTRLRLGILDFNNDFYVADYANLFLNGGFGMGTEVSGDGSVHTYPATGPALALSVEPGPLYLQGGLWKGRPNAEGVLRNGDGGLFSVWELGLRRGASGAAGYYKLALGGWRQSNPLEHWAGEDWRAAGRAAPAFAAAPRDGNGGLYTVGEVALGGRLGLFAKLGWADAERSRYGFSSAVGVNLQGALPGRAMDVLGVGFLHSQHSADFLDYAQRQGSLYFRYEQVLELTYSARLGRHLLLQPDFQYVLQPGMDPAIGNALVFGLRLQALW